MEEEVVYNTDERILDMMKKFVARLWCPPASMPTPTLDYLKTKWEYIQFRQAELERLIDEFLAELSGDNDSGGSDDE